MYAELAWVLLSSGTQVQPQIILDPDYLPDYLSVSYDYEIAMITRQMTPFFHLLFELCSLVYFIFAFQDLQNSVLWSPLLALCCGLSNIFLHAKDDTLKPLIIDILFYIKHANFLYLTFSISYLIPICLQSSVLYF